MLRDKTMILNVENFGKIKHASIDISGYSIFVGDNNSGKSYLMQLIYGVLDAFRAVHQIGEIPAFHLPTEENPLEVNQDNFQQFFDALNSWLDKEKNKIIKSTFNHEISIGKLWLSCEAKCPNITLKPAAKDNSKLALDKDFFNYKIYIDNIEKGGFGILKKLPSYTTEEQEVKNFLCNYLFDILMYERSYGNGLLYLPSCRSGLNLLYKDVVGEYASRASFMNIRDEDSLTPSKKLGLTKPFFDYMLFLQKYKKDDDKVSRNKTLISFIDNEILKGGHIDRENDEIRYITENGLNLPLHVSSSMVNEISPIIHVLTSQDRIKNILYDEIETSQHPKTQLQLARLLNRLVNAGYRMIVSTHSDTMAAAISNLVTLSFCENNLEKAKELGYEKEDLLKKDCVHAYQFENENGETVVKELEKFVDQGIGYDFTLFNKANERLYADYQVIARDDA